MEHMSNNKKIITNENIYLLVFGLWFLTLNLSRTYFRSFFNLSNVLTIGYGIVYIYFLWYLMTMEEKSKVALAKMLVFIIIGALSYHFSGVSYLLSLTCMCVCARDVDYKKIFKVFIIIALAVMVVTVIASNVGFIQANVTEGTRFRTSLGYTYYSYPSHMILFVTLAYIAIRGKLTLIETALLAIINYIVYFYTDTRVPFYTACFILACCLISLGIKKIKKLPDIGQYRPFKNVIIISPFIFLVFSYAIHFFYNSDSSFWVKLNQWLNTRLELGHAAILSIPQTLFGQKISWDDWAEPLGFSNYFFVDNSFINIMLNEGALFMILVLIGYCIVIKKAFDLRNYGLILAIIGCLILGIADPELADPRFQPMVLLIGWMLRPEGKQNVITKEGDTYGQDISYCACL